MSDSDVSRIKITVRRKNKLSMPNVVLHIQVDHKPVGKITVNGVVFYETEPGEHEIEVFVFRGIRTSGTFTFTEDSNVTIHTKLGKLELTSP